MLDMLASLQSFDRSPVSIDTWKIFCNIGDQTNYHKAGRTREIAIKGQRIKIIWT
jgi:hypothetical protein